MNTEMDDRDVLQCLCRDLRDSADGYREAAYLNSAHSHASIFRNRAQQREKMLETLETRYKTLPVLAEPPSDEAAAGHLPQQFIHFRSLLTHDETAAFAEIEKVEDYLMDQLRQALVRRLSLETYAVVTDMLTILNSSREAEALQATA